ncbi:MAG: hypothetical protein HYV27_15180 [Candidatus Hydrogenedentes bacterium]|nr:hypothetical protein [Candidatus Hydrogenedentota bacterium]
MSKLAAQFMANHGRGTVKAGTRFKLRPLQFVLSMHSSLHWHGFSRGNMAAMWEWFVILGEKSNPVWSSLISNSGLTSVSCPGLGLPLNDRDIEAGLSRVLVDHIIDGTPGQSVMVNRSFSDPFFPETDHFFREAFKGSPLFRRSPNRYWKAAREIYSAQLIYSLRRGWYLKIKYGFDGSSWDIALCRADAKDLGVWPHVCFPEGISNLEFDALLLAWLLKHVRTEGKTR